MMPSGYTAIAEYLNAQTLRRLALTCAGALCRKRRINTKDARRLFQHHFWD